MQTAVIYAHPNQFTTRLTLRLGICGFGSGMPTG